MALLLGARMLLGTRASLLVTRALLPIRNKKLLGAPGIATRSILTSKKDATCLETLFGQTDYDTDEQTTKWSAGPRTL